MNNMLSFNQTNHWQWKTCFSLRLVILRQANPGGSVKEAESDRKILRRQKRNTWLWQKWQCNNRLWSIGVEACWICPSSQLTARIFLSCFPTAIREHLKYIWLICLIVTLCTVGPIRIWSLCDLWELATYREGNGI